jgi:hypothetical protein
MVAADELGVTHLANQPPYWFGQPLNVDNSTESAIYAITCNSGLRFDDYSMPDGIARAAQMLGLDVTVYMSGCVMPAVLRKGYPAVMGELARLNVPVEQGTPTLDENERMLVVVNVGLIGGLHYVLYRPDRTYMDPAYGMNHQGSLWGMGQMYVFRYIDTGIYIVVGRNVV